MLLWKSFSLLLLIMDRCSLSQYIFIRWLLQIIDQNFSAIYTYHYFIGHYWCSALISIAYANNCIFGPIFFYFRHVVRFVLRILHQIWVSSLYLISWVLNFPMPSLLYVHWSWQIANLHTQYRVISIYRYNLK